LYIDTFHTAYTFELIRGRLTVLFGNDVYDGNISAVVCQTESDSFPDTSVAPRHNRDATG
jgi:hypothetical protein